MEVALAKIDNDPPPIDQRAPGVDVDRVLDAFMRRLLARDVDQRFATALDRYEVLELFVHDRYGRRRRARRHRYRARARRRLAAGRSAVTILRTSRGALRVMRSRLHSAIPRRSSAHFSLPAREIAAVVCRAGREP